MNLICTNFVWLPYVSRRNVDTIAYFKIISCISSLRNFREPFGVPVLVQYLFIQVVIPFSFRRKAFQRITHSDSFLFFFFSSFRFADGIVVDVMLQTIRIPCPMAVVKSWRILVVDVGKYKVIHLPSWSALSSTHTHTHKHLHAANLDLPFPYGFRSIAKGSTGKTTATPCLNKMNHRNVGCLWLMFVHTRN